MNEDPKRWLDASSDAPEGARELLRHARPAARVDKATLAASAAALAKLTATPAAAAAALPVAAKLVLSVCVATAVTTVAVRTLAPHAQEKPRAHAAAASVARKTAQHSRGAAPASATLLVEQTPVSPTDAPSEPRAVAAPLAEQPSAMKPPDRGARPRVAGRVSVSRSADRAVVPEPPTPDALALEVAGLDRARSLLASDPGGALALVAQGATRAPNAVLAEERELIAIDALHRLGRSAEARARADALLARHPASLYARRIDAMLR
jgi:hypothetical protein